MPAAERSVHVVVSGRVQGVWFRAWTQEQAQRHGLAGWVRNLRDGRVEAVFSGPAPGVAAMCRALWEGPPHAEVTAVDEQPTEEAVESGFHIRPTP